MRQIIFWAYRDDEAGQTIAAYGLIMLLIMVAAAAIVAILGGRSSLFQSVPRRFSTTSLALARLAG